jgi:hypothetical protein
MRHQIVQIFRESLVQTLVEGRYGLPAHASGPGRFDGGIE